MYDSVRFSFMCMLTSNVNLYIVCDNDIAFMYGSSIEKLRQWGKNYVFALLCEILLSQLQCSDKWDIEADHVL